MNKYIIVLLALSLTGCVSNPYGQYYTDHTGGKGVLNNPIFIGPQKDPTLMRGGYPLEDCSGNLKWGHFHGEWGNTISG